MIKYLSTGFTNQNPKSNNYFKASDDIISQN